MSEIINCGIKLGNNYASGIVFWSFINTINDIKISKAIAGIPSLQIQQKTLL